MRLRTAVRQHATTTTMGSEEQLQKVHGIHTDSQGDKSESLEQLDRPRRPSVNGAINHARPRPFRIPRPVSQSYPAYKGKQECALKIGIHQIWDEELKRSTGLSHVEIQQDMLILQPQHSQSKLSQQELSDLQKATHFDKKELQQWYKGTCHSPAAKSLSITDWEWNRLPKGLPLGHAHENRIPKDLQAILSLRRPFQLRRLRLQRLRLRQIRQHRLQGVHLRPVRH